MGDIHIKKEVLKLGTLEPNYDERVKDLAPNVIEADVKATHEFLSHLDDLTAEE